MSVPATSMRRTQTPNAVMTTCASPTQGPSQELSLWRIAMDAGQRGPAHVFDAEQIWHLLSGQANVRLGEEVHLLGPGDAIVLPAGAERQITALTSAELIACGSSVAVVQAVGEDHPRGTPAWIA